MWTAPPQSPSTLSTMRLRQRQQQSLGPEVAAEAVEEAAEAAEEAAEVVVEAVEVEVVVRVVRAARAATEADKAEEDQPQLVMEHRENK